jgi:hypothetical protein
VADHPILEKDISLFRAAAYIVNDERDISRFVIRYKSDVRDPAPEIPGNDVTRGIGPDVGLG